MHIRTARSGTAAALLICLAVACGGEEEPAPEAEAPGVVPAAPEPALPTTAGNLPAGVTAEMVQQGQQIFTGPGICFTCHGPNAQGTALAPDLTDDEWLNLQPGDNLYQQIVDLVHTGVPQPREHPAPMPPLGGAQLTEDQVRAVAAYVYSLSQG